MKGFDNFNRRTHNGFSIYHYPLNCFVQSIHTYRVGYFSRMAFLFDIVIFHFLIMVVLKPWHQIGQVRVPLRY
ncbi:hypothetical protein D3C85_1801940 [compost metagenome]